LMGIKDKQEIEEDIGIAAFVDKCREFAMENKVSYGKGIRFIRCLDGLGRPIHDIGSAIYGIFMVDIEKGK
jgi:hypothetical protein